MPELLGRLERKYLAELLGDAQLLGNGEGVVDLSFGLPVELGFDLMEEHEVAVEHLEAVQEAVGTLLFEFDRVDGVDHDLVGLVVGVYFELVELQLDVAD